MNSLDMARAVLRDALGLGERAGRLGRDSQLLGGMPEFDSMAVVSVITALESQLGLLIDDDELSAELFGSVGTLADFIELKIGNR